MTGSLQKIPSLRLGIFIIGIVFLVGSGFFRGLHHPERNLVAPPPGMKHLSFGFQETLADSLWLRAIQDFDYCDHPLSRNQCRGQSWLYKMLDTITDLSPRFRTPYLTGALALSILIDDKEGAARLFDKGVAAFPHDWQLSYKAAYHYLYEMKNSKRAAELLVQSAKNGGPFWLNSLANRLYVDSGNTELAEALLQDMIQSGQDPQLIERMKQKLESIKKKPQ